jgi:pyrrolidone-carboxylate peptidase
VVWGAPREHLQKWIDQYQPAAIFAFGQGGPDGFAFESKASNRRGKKYKDNKGELPPSPTIVDDGPDRFDATIACDQFARALRAKGYLARVSTRAGRYLCEEMLYTLEYLKSTRPLKGTVLFCHVPALNGFVPCDRLTPEYLARLAALGLLYRGAPPPTVYVPARYVKVDDVQRFVKDTLETWHTLYHGKASAAARASQGEAGESREHKEIKEFIGRYFRTWSNQDMKGYEACFLPEASIQHISTAGRLTTSTRPQFIASQRNYHRTSPVRTTEVAESVDIRLEEKLARVVVFWKLTAGARTEWGYDHFTLMRHDGQWRIVNLVFYETPPPGKGKKSER